MRVLFIRRLQLALLFILIAPLQTFAGFLPSAASTSIPVAAAHCPHHPSSEKHGVQIPGCGMSCCVALPAQASPQLTAQRFSVGRAAALASLPPPTVVLDRLDRPPR